MSLFPFKQAFKSDSISAEKSFFADGVLPLIFCFDCSIIVLYLII